MTTPQVTDDSQVSTPKGKAAKKNDAPSPKVAEFMSHKAIADEVAAQMKDATELQADRIARALHDLKVEMRADLRRELLDQQKASDEKTRITMDENYAKLFDQTDGARPKYVIGLGVGGGVGAAVGILGGYALSGVVTPGLTTSERVSIGALTSIPTMCLGIAVGTFVAGRKPADKK